MLGKKLPIRKRSYLLLEIMLCVALLSMCLIPLIHPYLGIFKTELKHLLSIQLHREAQNALCNIKTELAENKWGWGDLIKKKKIDGELTPITIRTANGFKVYTPHYVIKKVSYANKETFKKNALLLEVAISFDDTHQFIRTIFLERHEKT